MILRRMHRGVLTLYGFFVLAVLLGCSDKKKKIEVSPVAHQNAPADPIVPQKESEQMPNEAEELETRCYNGEKAACDELGH